MQEAFEAVRRRMTVEKPNKPVKVMYNSTSMPIDKVAQRLILDSPHIPWCEKVPVAVRGDGACFFHSMSLAMYGHTGYSAEIRYK